MTVKWQQLSGVNEIMLRYDKCLRANMKHTGTLCEHRAGALRVQEG